MQPAFSIESPAAVDGVFARFPERLRAAFGELTEKERASLCEVRISRDRPVMVTLTDGDRFVTGRGLSPRAERALVADQAWIAHLLDQFTHASVYAVEEVMREGFLTLPGGHRVGLLGTPRVRGGHVEGFRSVAGFNIRLHRALHGVSVPLARAVRTPGGGIHPTLIVSPPGCGKTTLLRDLVRLLGYGDPALGLRPQRVGVADERSEIAACRDGVPQFDLSPRADVIDGCPKRFALSMLVRAMNPDVVVTDEVGHPADVEALLDAALAGAVLVCTAHGSSLERVRHRPNIAPLLEAGLFARIAVLSRRLGPGTLERVWKWGDAA